MPQARQSALGFFVQSSLGVRDTGGQLVFGPAALFYVYETSSNPNDPFSFNSCAGGIVEGGPPSSRVNFGPYYQHNVSDITQANQAVVTTSSPHYLTEEMAVFVRGVVGMTEINSDPPSRVSILSPTSYVLLDVNSTGYSPYVSGGETRTSLDPTFRSGLGNFRVSGLTSGVSRIVPNECFPTPGVNSASPATSNGVDAAMTRSNVPSSGFAINEASLDLSTFIVDEPVIYEQVVTVPVVEQLPDATGADWAGYLTQVQSEYGTGPPDADQWEMIEPAGAITRFENFGNGTADILYVGVPSDAGTTKTFTVRAKNSQGQDDMSWQVTFNP